MCKAMFLEMVRCPDPLTLLNEKEFGKVLELMPKNEDEEDHEKMTLLYIQVK